MAIRTRSDQFHGLWTNIKTENLYKVSRLVSRLTGIRVQRNKAIVGANAFSHESGVHQDGMLKKRSTYEIMKPADIGLDSSALVLGKHSGRHAFKHELARLGIILSDDEQNRAYEHFIELADKKKYIYDDDLLMIAREEMDKDSNVYILDYLHVSTGTNAVPTATVRIRKGGEVKQDAACGDGPVDAVLKSIDRMTGIQGKLLDFSIEAITVGKDAMGEVSVQVSFGDERISSKAASTDIVEASAKAYLSCVNRFLSRKLSAKTARQKVRGKKKSVRSLRKTRRKRA